MARASWRGSRLKLWKTKPIFSVAHRGQGVVVHPVDRFAVQVVLAGGRRVEAAEHVHQGRLAAAGGAHDGDVVAAADLEVEAGEGAHLFPTHW